MNKLTGDDLRRLRRQLGMTQKSASYTYGVSRTSWDRWENGDKQGCSGDRLGGLCRLGDRASEIYQDMSELIAEEDGK